MPRINERSPMTAGNDAHKVDDYARALENAEKRRAWEAQREESKKEQERQEQRDELTRYINRRSEDYRNLLGVEPAGSDIQRWTREHLDAKAAEAEIARVRKLEESVAEHYNW